jgi:hypothetical protein
MKLVELDESAMASREAKSAGGGAAAKSAPQPEIDLSEVDRILEEEAKQQQQQAKKRPAARQPAPAAASPKTGPSPAPVSPEPQPAATTPLGIEEGRPFDDYYTLASVPESPYPAEKLLKVLDGLKALDPVTRKAAVLAMDAAEDAWSIADVVLDAQRKLRVLTEALKQLDQQVNEIAAHADSEKQKLDGYLSQATETIRRKIAEAEHTLQNETAQVTAQKTRLDTELEGAAGARDREAARLRGEMRRLHELCTSFAIERTNA